MENIVETINLTKKYGDKYALDKVSVHVRKGEIYGLVGRNGAGKTTLMRIICGLSHATAGEFKLFGQRGDKPGMLAQRRGMLIEDPGYFSEFDAETNLRIKCKLLGINDREEPRRLLRMVGLGDVGKKKVGQYSLGMKQRLGIAIAMAGNPDIVVLDEPINGLDADGMRLMREILTDITKNYGCTVLISSHILGELEKIATHYGIIRQGKMIQELTAQEMESRCRMFSSVKAADMQQAFLALKQKYGNVQAHDGSIRVYDVNDTEGIVEYLLEAGITPSEVKKNRIGLEEYYIELMSRKEDR